MNQIASGTFLKKSIGIGIKDHCGQSEKADILSFVRHIHTITSMNKKIMLGHLGLISSTYYNWLERSEKDQLSAEKPVGKNPYHLLDWKKEAIWDFYMANQGHGYRRITYPSVVGQR